MLSYLHSEDFAKIVILSLPTAMASNEAIDLREELQAAGDLETEIYFNNSLKALSGIENIELPGFLKAKLQHRRANNLRACLRCERAHKA